MTTPIGCPGFRFSGVPAGIKKVGRKDLGLVVSDVPATLAGMFTRNRVKAAPVLIDMERAASGTAQAVIANSGNANCCTGTRGAADAEAMASAAADALGLAEQMVLVASTGVIGEPMPMDRIFEAMPALLAALSPDGAADFAEAIMTTDTVPKLCGRHVALDGRPVTVVGIAKGAGMIRPDMATMLCFICTDVAAPAGQLQWLLESAVNSSFNRITIDGDTSTNDTVLLMANGRSGVSLDRPETVSEFQAVLDDLTIELARLLVRDGEGVTKVVEIAVSGAEAAADARRVADTVAHSNLVKTAFFGEDANWGRILGAVGRAGVRIDPDRIAVFFDDVQMVQDGVGCGKTAEAAATEVLRKPDFTVRIDLGLGPGTASVMTCDFSIDYVRINADYRS